MYTPRKIHMEPKNHPTEKGKSSSKFQTSIFRFHDNFPGCVCICMYVYIYIYYTAQCNAHTLTCYGGINCIVMGGHSPWGILPMGHGSVDP